jgi:hypothetical protein
MDIDPRNTSADLKLIRQAIKNRWPVPDHVRVSVVEQMANIVGGMGIDGEPKPKDEIDDRARVNAARVLLAADLVNLKDEELDKPPGDTHNHFTGPVLITSVLAEPDYVEYLRSRVLEADSDPGTIRPNGEPGPLENGQAPRDHRPGANGCSH